MNEGQEMFYNFLMERVKEDKAADARELLLECFARQNAGTFDRNYFDTVLPRFHAVIKPEAVEEVSQVMTRFAANL